MRCPTAIVLACGCAALAPGVARKAKSAVLFVAPSTGGDVHLPGRTDVGLGAGALVPPSAVAPKATSSYASFGTSAAIGAAALFVAALGAARGRRHNGRARKAVVVRADGDVDPMGDEIYMAKGHGTSKNYVNPWERYVTKEDSDEVDPNNRRFTQAFHTYEGPVYKKVPVVEGLSFPLDPTKFKEPLVPPPPGAKWGDGRSPDGKWYMDIDGQKTEYWQGVGRRKTACAIVRIVESVEEGGQFIVNGKEGITYFSNFPIWWLKAMEPLAALSQKNNFDVICKCFGGGSSGQAGAIRLGLARAMQEYNYNWRPLLKKAKYLTRDSRTVESKKTGKPKARKDTPYHKR